MLGSSRIQYSIIITAACCKCVIDQRCRETTSPIPSRRTRFCYLKRHNFHVINRSGIRHGNKVHLWMTLWARYYSKLLLRVNCHMLSIMAIELISVDDRRGQYFSHIKREDAGL